MPFSTAAAPSKNLKFNNDIPLTAATNLEEKAFYNCSFLGVIRHNSHHHKYKVNKKWRGETPLTFCWKAFYFEYRHWARIDGVGVVLMVLGAFS